MDKILGILAFVYGLYLCFGSCKMRHKGLINVKILLKEDSDAYRCKDTREYIAKMFPRVIVMGCAFLLFGGTELYNSVTGKAGNIFAVSFYVFFAIFMWYEGCREKYEKEYF